MGGRVTFVLFTLWHNNNMHWHWVFTSISYFNKMGCFNDPALKVCVWWGGWVADTNYLYPACWGWIKKTESLVCSYQLCYAGCHWLKNVNFQGVLANRILSTATCRSIYPLPFYISNKLNNRSEVNTFKEKVGLG